MQVVYQDLKDKVILVTGASTGIGASISKELAKQGAHIVLNHIEPNEKVVEKLIADIEELGGKATPLKFDVTNNDAVKENLSNFIKEHGPITGLVNNAGISKDQLMLRIKEDDIHSVIDINLKGAMLVTAALTRNFLKGENVSIVNISSVVGLMGNPGQAAYSASKAGLIGFTKTIAKELASKNVRCNAICPGFIKTDMTGKLDARVVEQYQQSIPLSRMGDAKEVANLTCFFLSQISSYITGESIKIDGGLYI